MNITTTSLLVLSTGLEESVYASSIAKRGNQVVHLDQEKQYGGLWKSMNLMDLIHHLFERSKDDVKCVFENVDVEFNGMKKLDNSILIELIKKQSTEIDLNNELLSKDEYSKIKELLKHNRTFNLELNLKLLLSRGEMIEILQLSKASNYLEFQLLKEELILDDQNQFKQVPFSKEMVFSNEDLSLIEKRKLVRFLKFVNNFEDNQEVWKEHENEPLLNFMEQKFQLSNNLINAIVYNVMYASLNANQTDVITGLTQMQTFLKSMGRFGNHSLLYTIYGTGSELCQAFCRVAAIYNGLYKLEEPIKKINFEDRISVKTQHFDNIDCDQLVINLDHLTQDLYDEWVEISAYHYKTIIIIPYQLQNSIQHMVIPPKYNESPLHIIALNHETKACDIGYSVIYLSMFYKQKQNEKDIKHYFDNGVQLVLKYFNVEDKPLVNISYLQKIRKLKQDIQLPDKLNIIEDDENNIILNGIKNFDPIKTFYSINQYFEPELNLE